MIDKHDAPDGYIAVKAEPTIGCSDCSFSIPIGCIGCGCGYECGGSIHGCGPDTRLDKQPVIFIPDPDKQVNKETEQAMQDIVNGDNVEQVDAETLLKDFDNKLVELAKIRNKIEQVLGRG